jgi:predicted oxidoreductase
MPEGRGFTAIFDKEYTMATTLTLGPIRVSRLVPGLMRLLEWNLDAHALRDWIAACVDMGLTTFDHADIYGGYQCEAAFGAALALDPLLRAKLQLVTKCGIALIKDTRPDHNVKHYNTSRAHILASAEMSLRNLRTDVLDLLLIHRPDPLFNADETAAALTELRDTGKVLAVGVSNFTPAQFDLLQSRLSFALVTNQVEFSLAHHAPLWDGTFDQAQRLRVPPMVWSPLGGGRLLTEDSATRAKLHALAHEYDTTADVIALAWVLQHPSQPLPVLGTGKLERIANLRKAETITLDRQQWFSLLEAAAGHAVP